MKSFDELFEEVDAIRIEKFGEHGEKITKWQWRKRKIRRACAVVWCLIAYAVGIPRRLFWFIYSRLRLRYIYGKSDLPWSERPADYKCPTCFWDSTTDDYYENCIGTHSHTHGWEGSESWVEEWKCPRCGTTFECSNGN